MTTDVKTTSSSKYQDRLSEAHDLADDMASGRWSFEKGNARVAEAQVEALSANDHGTHRAGKGTKAHSAGGSSKTLEAQATLTDDALAENAKTDAEGISSDIKANPFGGQGNGVTPDILPST